MHLPLALFAASCWSGADMNDHIYVDEYEIEELRAQVRFEKQRHARLMRNPDCRDPDHPGCEHCMETDDECWTFNC